MHTAVVAVIVVAVSVVISLCVLVIGLTIIRRYPHCFLPCNIIYSSLFHHMVENREKAKTEKET